MGTAKMRLIVVATVATLAASAKPSRAASLTVDAPDGCIEQATLDQEIADLVGRPLAESPDADFRVTIAPARAGRWHLKLETIGSPTPGSQTRAGAVRELDGAKCAELAEAAAVAIAVSVRALADRPPPAPRAPAPDAAVQTAGPAPTIAVVAAPREPPWRPGLTLSVAGDTGELPGTGLGVMGGAIVGRGRLRLALTVGWFPARDAAAVQNGGGNGGGRFQLVFAGGDACFAPARGRWTVLACGGVEVGAYRAAGQDVARPTSRTTLWLAGRGRLGVAVGLNDSVAFAVNGIAVMPVARPTFVLDGMEHVYRPSAVGGRIDAGLEVLF
ncbi:MAG TPA: hypothetical protein VHM31_17820 [Polyangia bacterium]|nr:hypothetical protein [Polyangia bacterium]